MKSHAKRGNHRLRQSHQQGTYCGCGATVAIFFTTFGVLALVSLSLVSFALPHQQQHPQEVTNNIHVEDNQQKHQVAFPSAAVISPTLTQVATPATAVPVPAVVNQQAHEIPVVRNSTTSSSALLLRRESPLNPWKKTKGAIDLHFIHIPKCGGTSMTGILRQVACTIDSDRNKDCCTNPGFCDYNDNKKCNSIRGCINHFPNRPWIFKPQPSITILREPVSRLLSAWFYRGHSPNADFFQVRPWFKEIKEGKRPKVIFPEYIEMNEYQNIQTRMLGGDSFPYRDVAIDEQVFNKAVDALNHLFFVGIQEAYDVSVKVMIRELNVPVAVEVKKERDQQSSKTITKQKADIKANGTLLARVREVNAYDIKLYRLGLIKFCKAAKKYDDLYQEVKTTTKVDCDQALRDS